MSFWTRLIIAIVIVLLVSEVSAELVNWLILLILAGMLLSQSAKVSSLLKTGFSAAKR